MKRATYLFPVLILSMAILATSCSQEGPQPAATPSQPTAAAPSPKSTVMPTAEAVPLTKDHLKALAASLKQWKASGHKYADINNQRAISDGLVPKEMVGEKGLVNLFGGPADISLAPANAGVPDTFLVLFSGVPNDACVKLAFPAPDGFVVYAGDFLKTATSEAQANSLCTTGNMWFVAK